MNQAFPMASEDVGNLSEFLSLLDLRGQCWCSVDIKSSGGFSVPATRGVMCYAVLGGTVRLAGIEDDVMELQPGDVVMILSGEPHALRTDPNVSVDYLEFLCADREVDIPPKITIGNSGFTTAQLLCGRLKVTWPAGLRRTSMPPFVGIRAHDFGFANSAVRIDGLRISAQGSGASALLTRTAAFMLAVALRRHPQCAVIFRLSSSSDPIAQALHLIDADPAADWTVASLAKKVHMGRSSFAARFAAEVGRTPMEVVTERRMSYAAELLKSGRLKIAEISPLVGYRSEAAFSRRFSQFFGVAPSHLRNNAKLKARFEELEMTWQMLLGSG